MVINEKIIHAAFTVGILFDISPPIFISCTALLERIQFNDCNLE